MPQTYSLTIDPVDRLPVSPTVRQALREARAALRQMYGERLERVVLFGSQARGEATEDSDVDLLVVLKDPVERGKELDRVSPLLFDLVLSTGELVTFVVGGVDQTTTSDLSVFVNVRREGITL